jgi:hypothetical protein
MSIQVHYSGSPKVVFAAGNKFETTKIDSMIREQNKTWWYVHGKRWIKSKGKFSTNALIHCVGQTEPVDVD